METSGAMEDRSRRVLPSRLMVGLVQGVALYFLYTAMEDRTWPSGSGLVFAPLVFVASYVPLILIVGVGNLRFVTLFVWSTLAAAIVAALAWYDIWHGTASTYQALGSGLWGEAPRILPGFAVSFFSAVGIFIAQALITAGDAERLFKARYESYFDVAWKLGLQLFLAATFVLIFWCVLWLGAALFGLIGIDSFKRLIEHRWFSIPATALALAAALHLTDVRASLVRGARTLVLVLLSWLLPLMAGIAAAFLASLVSTGLDPLWKTGFAAGYLLIAAGLLVFLINAAFQDGTPERAPHAILRYSGSVASLLLVPLVALSAYAIHLRVEQYGWTTSRVAACACLVVAASYAVGYASAILPFDPWMRRIGHWNFLTSLLVLAVIGAVFSPLADPVRIAVDSQTGRLLSGKVPAGKFDFHYLRWNGGRFGVEALHRIADHAAGPDAEVIKRRAKAELAETSEFGPQPPKLADLSQNISVYPSGRSLPKSFVTQDWSKVTGPLPPCLQTANMKCDAYILDIGDGKPRIAVIGSPPTAGFPYGNGLFEAGSDGSWRLVGRPNAEWACPSIALALQSARWKFVPPATPRWPDVMAGSKRIRIDALELESATCP